MRQIESTRLRHWHGLLGSMTALEQRARQHDLARSQQSQGRIIDTQLGLALKPVHQSPAVG